QAPAEYGLDVAALAGLLAGAVHERLHARVAFEVQVDVLLGAGAVDAELTAEAEGGHAVDQSEVDRLGGPALLVADLVEFGAEHLGRGRPVNVLAGGERRLESLVAAKMRHDAQLDLRIVGRDEPAALVRDEGLADAPSLGGA